jgi:hypothetical protein
MEIEMNGTLSNNQRKFVATARRGPGSLRKGNRYNSSTARDDARDTKPAFPQIVFGNERSYTVAPYIEIDGIFFDVEARPVRKLPAKKRAQRTDPGPGRRPSLSKIRAK